MEKKQKKGREKREEMRQWRVVRVRSDFPNSIGRETDNRRLLGSCPRSLHQLLLPLRLTSLFQGALRQSFHEYIAVDHCGAEFLDMAQ